MSALSLIFWWLQNETVQKSTREVLEGARQDVIRALPKILIGMLVLFAFIILARIGQRAIALTAPRVNADTGTVLLLSRVYYYGILTFGLIMALATAGLDVSALIAGLGLTGFALGFALKDVLSNLLAGIMLLFYRPFEIGDYIEMGVYHGQIETIRMRDTVVRDAEDRLIIIPNTKLITEVVVNNRDNHVKSKRLREAQNAAQDDTYDDVKAEEKDRINS